MQNNKYTSPYDLRSQTSKTRETLRTKSESDVTENINTENIGEVEAYKNKTKIVKNKDKTEMANNELSELIRLLSLQVKNEQDQNKKTIITVDTFAKIISDFDGENVPVDKWFNNFEQNAEAHELNDKQKYVQARNKVVGVAKMFLETKSISNYESLKEALITEFKRDYDSGEIHKMLKERKKTSTESFHEYMLCMRKIAALGDVEERAVVRYIVDGLPAKSVFKQNMYASKNFKELRENYEIYERVNVNTEIQNKKWHKANETKITAGKIHCYNCGSTEHKRNECKAQTKCFKCNKFGHISKQCKANENNQNDVLMIVDQKRYKCLKVNEQLINGLIDTGSDVSIIKRCVYENKFKNCPLKVNDSLLTGLGNMKTKPYGSIECNVKVDEVETKQNFLILPNDVIKCDILIGHDFISKFKMIVDSDGYEFKYKNSDENNIFNVFNINAIEIDADGHYKEEIENLIQQYNPSSSSQQCTVEMKIVPNGEIKPFRHSPTRLPFPEEQEVNRQVQEWLQKGIVRKSCSDVASRVVVTKKKTGEYRVCVDFRQLNNMVLKDGFPVPVIEDVLQKLQKAKFFCVMDLENGFFHVPIDEASKKFTAFVTKQGLYEFNRAPFGFCNSPACFIRYINFIFQELITADVMELYMDDIVVYSETEEGNMNKLKLVLEVAQQYGLQIKWSKCTFMKTKIDFLGHTIEGGKVWPGKAKTKAVANFPEPKNIKDVQSFLGLTGYFRKFIQNYAYIAKPLSNLLKKNVIFKINEDERNAIDKLKASLTNEPVLRIFCREAETELHTDASKEGFGATLLQKFEGQLHPVFFYSKKASVQEGRLHSYILEVKAAYIAFKKFRHYVLGIHFKLVTDCSAFKQTISKKDVPRDVAQWILYFQDFDYTVEHRSGNRMKHVDSLSRYPTDVMIISSDIAPRFLKQQHEDEYIKAIIQTLSFGPYESFKMKGGLVYKNINGNDLLIVPKLMEVEIIKNAHENGHYATQKTMHAIQQQYYIPHLEKKVQLVINNCVKCIIYNKKTGKKEGFLSCIDKGNVPLETIHIDHLGPMDATSKMYKYILAMVDGFSKFVWLFPTKTTNAEEAIRCLKVWSDTFGFPTRIISDKGSAFTSHNFEDFCKHNGIEHVLTTTGVARGNGQIERVNRVIVSIIAKLSNDDPTKWYKVVGDVQKAINSCMHNSTKTTPFQILVGVKMKTGLNDNILQMLQDEMIQKFDDDRQHLRTEAKKQIQKAQVEYKRNFDKRRKEDDGYQVGDLVAIKRTQFVSGRKLASEFLGPYKVDRVKRNNRYDVVKAANFEGPNKTSTSSDFMKPWKNYESVEYLLSSGTDE